MTQTKTETVTGFIEKLEALPRFTEPVTGAHCVFYADINAIIEQEKSKISEGLKNSQAEQKPLPICNLWVNPENFNYEVDHCTHPLDELIPVYTSPQPTPQDVIDAERWRWFIENWGEPHVEQAIDQAMKGE